MMRIFSVLLFLVITAQAQWRPWTFFNAASVPANPLAWWQADTFNSQTNFAPVGASGTVWTDISGHGYDATQSNSGLRPNVALGVFGTLPGVALTNANTFLTNNALTFTGDFTIVCVMSNVLTDGLIFGNSGLNRQIRVVRSLANTMSYYAGGSEVISSTLGTSIDSMRALTWRRSSGTVSFRENKTARGSGADANTQVLNQMFQNTGGSGKSPGGFYGEIMIWDRFITDAEMDALYDRYLRQRYRSLP